MKTRIISIMELIFSKKKSDWQITFGELAQTARIQEAEVEWMLMKAMALGLLKGKIDEVARTVSFTYVQPRVLDTNRTTMLNERMKEWKNTVNMVLTKLEADSRELFD
jgi:26S proteasome regulatory subunit N9